MSFNRRILPEVEKLVKMREKAQNDEEFIKSLYRGADALQGSTESFNYVAQVKYEIEKKINKRDEN
jgi:hypothetical protein